MGQRAPKSNCTKKDLPKPGRSFQRYEVLQLLLALSNCHGHGDGSADHGVVAHAQEAHHLNIKSACRRLCLWATRVSAEVIISFYLVANTTPSPRMMWFLFSIIQPLSFVNLREVNRPFGTSFNLFQHPKTRSIIFESKCHIFYQKEMKKNMFFFNGYPAILDTPFAIIKSESER